MNKRLLTIAAVAGLLVSVNQAQAVQESAKAKMKVISGLTVTRVSDLIFTEAAAGAPAETVDPSTTETDSNASFAITGEAGKAITVTLPTNGTVKMMTGGGGSPDNEIAVDDFINNTLTNIGGAGTAELYQGATRAALSATQAAGDYEADFTVDVVY